MSDAPTAPAPPSAPAPSREDGAGSVASASAASPSPVPPERPSRLIRLYFAASGVWGNAMGLMQAVFDGVWLGLFRRADLYRIDQHFYDRNPVYNADAHNLRGLLSWEETAIREHFGGCRRVMVLGAGGGREVLALARQGLAVHGYECNPALVEYAAEFLPRQGCDARINLLPRDQAPAPTGEPFDGIVIGWGAYTLMPGRAHRIELLRRLRPLVRPGGPLLLSFYTRGRDGGRFRVSAAVANAFRALLRRERIERGDALSPNFIHYFTAAEIAAELREAGFEPHRYTPHGSGNRDSGWAIGLAPMA